MISSQNVRNPVVYERNFVTDQSIYGWLISRRLTTAAGFDATYGLGQGTTDTSTVVTLPFTIPGDIKLTFRGSYGSFTTAAQSDFGVFLRNSGLDSSPADYQGYYARMDNGQARITRVEDVAAVTTYTNLTSSAMACAANDVLEITFSVVGTLLTATFENQTANPGTVLTLTATDSTFTSGFNGFRSLSSTVWCRYFKAEQL